MSVVHFRQFCSVTFDFECFIFIAHNARPSPCFVPLTLFANNVHFDLVAEIENLPAGGIRSASDFSRTNSRLKFSLVRFGEAYVCELVLCVRIVCTQFVDGKSYLRTANVFAA